MLCQDGITFVDEVEAYQQLYPYSLGMQDDFMTAHQMSAHTKQSYDAFDMNHYNAHSGAPYLASSYESPLTDQNDLTALPHSYGSGYDEALYGHNPTDEYSSRTVVPTTIGAYSTGSVATSTHLPNQVGSYDTRQPSRKRKASVESFEGEAPAPKRIALALQDPSGEYYEVKSEASPYSSLVPTPTTLSAFHIPQHHVVSPRLMGHHHSTSNVSQASIPAAAPYTPTVSPSFTTANTEHSPRAPATPGPPSVSVASNPKLIRTSTIPQHSPRPVQSNVSMIGHTQTFNPFSLYSPDSKARLHLEGSLDDVAKDWSEAELEARRKIVVFDREQKNNDIYATFKVVSQEDWKNQPRSVSCIWWAEKKEAYVTSVDTISLLEGIVAARFTVEEKNRIRRNLEGFKPDTVSKAKPDTEEFFKVIMGFPNPKPRNIEKDVKVFPWKVLSIALQKIISKYSASYASTAASISSQPKIFRPMEHPADFRYSHSPGPEYHNSNPQMASFPVYETHGRASAPITPVAHMHVPHHAGYGPEAHASYPYGHGNMHMHQQQQHQVQYHAPPPMSAPAVAPTQYWQYPTYTMEGSMSMPPASAPPTAYPREMIETADFRHVPYTIHAAHHH